MKLMLQINYFNKQKIQDKRHKIQYAEIATKIINQFFFDGRQKSSGLLSGDVQRGKGKKQKQKI